MLSKTRWYFQTVPVTQIILCVLAQQLMPEEPESYCAITIPNMNCLDLSIIFQKKI
jgi:hypothetical protein